MATYVLTGGATGIGAATKRKLRSVGHTVITVDIKEADYVTDLGDASARTEVIDAIKRAHPALDGIITCAGVGSDFPDPAKILAINFFATVEEGHAGLFSKHKKIPSHAGDFCFLITSNTSGLLVQEAAKLLRAARVAKLTQRFSLNLTDTLTSNVKLLAHFF